MKVNQLGLNQQVIRGALSDNGTDSKIYYVGLSTREDILNLL